MCTILSDKIIKSSDITGRGQSAPLMLAFYQEIFADLQGKDRQGKKGNGMGEGKMENCKGKGIIEN